ncbi:hypothetical protein QTP88_025630 [Uroleucon formosanum]
MHKSQKQPSGSGSGKKSKWSYYSQMTFLIPYIEFRETIGNYSRSEICNQQRINSPETDIIKEVSTTPERCNEQIEHNIKLRVNKCSSATKKRKNEAPEDNIDEQILNIISKEHDADEQFLLSYLQTLKRMTPKQNAIAKIKIQQVLFDVEFGNNDSNSAFSSNSGHSTYSSVYTPILTPLKTQSKMSIADNGFHEYYHYSSQN